MASTRRLAAILATDVVGYSRLMGLDEEGTHERFKAHCREVFEPRIKQHHGRIVKSTGDGMLVEFQSVVEAVLCAVEVQCGMTRRNADVADDERVAFRIGINLGDVIVEPHDIFGDGVNIAARLEGLAAPDGICISQIVHDQVRDKLPYRFDDLGYQTVKNIKRPLHVFALRPAAIAALASTEVDLIAAPVASAPGSIFTPQRAPRLSIVVLPFANLSDDRDQQYLADAITDDVTTDLSRIADMVVISRNTADMFRDKPVNTRQIGRELNVRYVLEGSVRRAGSRIRVNSQLVDAEADTHVWADRFDHANDNLFRLQDEVTSRIAVALNLELVRAEAARPASANPDALDCILRGRAAYEHLGGSTPDRFVQAIGWFERALALDPSSVAAQALLAWALVGRVLDQISLAPDADIERAERLIETVLAESPSHAVAHFAKAQVLRAQHHYEAAIPEYETAISLNRNWVMAIANLGLCKFFSGAIEESIPAQELAIRLSPRDPHLPNWYWRIGMVHLLQSRIAEAILWIGRARTANSTLPGPNAWLASAYALNGDRERAAAALAAARRLSPDNRYDSIARFKSTQSLGSANINALAEATFLAGLRQAGVPDH
jgi:adenylate cyclase